MSGEFLSISLSTPVIFMQGNKSVTHTHPPILHPKPLQILMITSLPSFFFLLPLSLVKMLTFILVHFSILPARADARLCRQHWAAAALVEFRGLEEQCLQEQRPAWLGWGGWA